MASINLEDATIRLIEDMSLTDALDDANAKVVHQWGEGQLSLLANRAADEAGFEQTFADLRATLKMVNRFISKRATLDDDKQRRYIRLLAENAQQAGYAAPFDRVGAVVDAQKGLDDALTLRLLLAYVETGSVSVMPTSAGQDMPSSADDAAEDEAPKPPPSPFQRWGGANDGDRL